MNTKESLPTNLRPYRPPPFVSTTSTSGLSPPSLAYSGESITLTVRAITTPFYKKHLARNIQWNLLPPHPTISMAISMASTFPQRGGAANGSEWAPPEKPPALNHTHYRSRRRLGAHQLFRTVSYLDFDFECEAYCQC